jgi:hypothetical protein
MGVEFVGHSNVHRPSTLIALPRPNGRITINKRCENGVSPAVGIRRQKLILAANVHLNWDKRGKLAENGQTSVGMGWAFGKRGWAKHRFDVIFIHLQFICAFFAFRENSPLPISVHFGPILLSNY